LIGAGDEEIVVPGRNFGFEELMNSQAAGDADVLSVAGRPVLTLRFKSHASAFGTIEKLLDAS
jgi:hypothetical protein